MTAIEFYARFHVEKDVSRDTCCDIDTINFGTIMLLRTTLLISIIVLIFSGYARTQQQSDSLIVNDILHKADSATARQDTLLAHAKYKFREDAIFNEIDDKGKIKNSDTTISVITMNGYQEVSREIIRSTKTPEKRKNEQNSKGEIGFSLSPNNPDYRFSLTETNDSSYIIAIIPKVMPPKKGISSGTVVIDRINYFIRKIDLEVPKPEGALKEFATQMTFEPLEGGLVVMTEMNMKGFAKAFLGIFKMRFTGEIRHSNYEILK